MCGKPGTYDDVVAMPIARRVEFIDTCISRIVAALNAGGVPTVASCCGHGERNGSIVLDDGRELVIRKYEDKSPAPSQSPAPDADGGEDPSVTAEYARCGPVSHEEAEDIAQRYIDCAFNNRDKPRPLHCIPANPKTDSDIRLTAYIRQQKQREKDSAEALGRAEARVADVTEQRDAVMLCARSWQVRAEKAEARLAALDIQRSTLDRPEKTGGEG